MKHISHIATKMTIKVSKSVESKMVLFLQIFLHDRHPPSENKRNDMRRRAHLLTLTEEPFKLYLGSSY